MLVVFIWNNSDVQLGERETQEKGYTTENLRYDSEEDYYFWEELLRIFNTLGK